MSVMGTGVAAGVAQTTLQSQEQARKRDKKVREDEHSTQKVLEVFESHINGLEENDADAESNARLHVEAQVQDGKHLATDAHPNEKQNKIAESTAASTNTDTAELSLEARQIAHIENQPDAIPTPLPNDQANPTDNSDYSPEKDQPNTSCPQLDVQA